MKGDSFQAPNEGWKFSSSKWKMEVFKLQMKGDSFQDPNERWKFSSSKWKVKEIIF